MVVEHSKRWLAFFVLCLGDLMVVLDMSVVNVALPSIKADLLFTDASLVWVVNAYLLTFGGFLMLGGRLGDLYGQKKLFLAGLTIFTLASLACGIVDSQFGLVAARAVQGIGGAITSAIALSLVVNIFTEAGERARAMGIFGFVMAGGGSVGVVLGGFLTAIDWHWNFLINIPIGILVFFLCVYLLPSARGVAHGERLDWMGAILITLAPLLAIYAVIGAAEAGWTSAQTLGLLAGAAVIFAIFIALERRVSHPIMPLRLFASRNLVVASIVGVLWAAAMFAWFFFAALYMQLVLGYAPQEVGFAFVPANVIMAIFSVSLSALLVMRFGLRLPAAAGLFIAALGLLLFALAPVDGSFVMHILPGMVLLGIGAGMAFNPVLLAAMGSVPPEDSGLASGAVNTAFMVGGSLGLAVLASTAAMRTGSLIAGGAEQVAALNSGYHAAFIVGGGFALAAALIAALYIQNIETPAHDMHA